MTDAPRKVGWMLSLLIRPGFPRLVSNYQFSPHPISSTLP